MSTEEDELTKLDFIHRSTNVRDIASVADFEVEETYEDNIEHYRDNGFSQIPLPYSEQYYDIENGELVDLDPDQVVRVGTSILEVMEKLIDHDFLFFDGFDKRVIDQPDGDSLPYRYEAGKIELDGEFYGPRQVYENYEELKDRLPKEKHDLLLGLAQERHRYFIITLPDVNKRPVRTLCYQLLMQLETRLADMIRDEYNSEELFGEVGHRTLGLWKQDEINDNKVHISEHMGIGDIKKVVRKNGDMVDELGFESKTKFGNQLSGVVQLRNKVMHPTRTLVHDTDHLEQQKDRLDRINELVAILIENQKERIDHPYSDDIELPDDI
jgi:hypothetical protein